MVQEAPVVTMALVVVDITEEDLVLLMLLIVAVAVAGHLM